MLKGQGYLGCKQVLGSVRILSGGAPTTMTYNMEDFLVSCMAKYLERVVPGTTL